MKVAVGEEVAKVTWAAERDDHLLDLDGAVFVVADGCEDLFIRRMEHVFLPQLLQRKRMRAVRVILQV